MAKISINYYLNDKLKSKGNEANGAAFPVYIRVIHKRILSRIKSISTRENLTEKEFETFCHSANVESEKKILQSFFDFSENTIKDFQINQSKTNFGDLLDFYCNLRFWAVLENIRTGFISPETRINMYVKLRDYFAKNTDFKAETINYIAPANIGLHADIQGGKQEYISLSQEVTKDFHEKGILTNKEAAQFEFIDLLNEYNFNKYRYPFEKKGGRNPNPHEFLTLYVWLREKPEILKYIAEKGQPYTRENLNEVAANAEKIFIEQFKKGYFEGWNTENETKQ